MMSDMFGEDVSQEEVDLLIASILDWTLDEYELKNVPVGDTLEDCLDAYTKVKLIKLADENGIEVKQSWKKTQVIEVLSDEIMDSIEERFLILQEDGLLLLQYLVEGKFSSAEYMYESADFFLNVFRGAIRLGILYAVVENDLVTIKMPSDIAEKMYEVYEKFDELRDEYHSELKYLDQVNEVLVAGVNLYGAMTTFRFNELWDIYYPDVNVTNLEEMREIYFIRNKYLHLLIIGNDYIFTHKYIIASPKFVDAENVWDFYNYRKNKMGADYYKPTQQEIEYYANHTFNQETLAYKRLKQEVPKITGDVDALLSFIEINILIGEDVLGLIDNAIDMGLIEFKSEKEFSNFMNMYINLQNSSRLWENAGFTPIELTELMDKPSPGYRIVDNSVWFDMDDEDYVDEDWDNIIPIDLFRRWNDEDED